MFAPLTEMPVALPRILLSVKEFMMVQPHIEYCSVCNKYVRLDQTREECAAEQGCDSKHCPMDQYFHYKSDDTQREAASDTEKKPQS